MGRTAARPPLFTIGYEGRSLPDFLAALQGAEVTRLIDVRELPLSRRKGFSKTPLRAALEPLQIEYVHVRDAGNPFRHAAAGRAGSLMAFRAYLEDAPGIVDQVLAAMTGARSALLCVEADPAACHRSILARAVAKRAKLKVCDL